GGQRHHVAARRSHVQAVDRVRRGARLRFGLRGHLVGAAEEVEVVDVGAAQEGLQAGENARDRYAQGLGALAVQHELNLRSAGVELREHTRQFRPLVRLGQKIAEYIGEFLQVAAAAVFEDEFESSRRADAGNGRRVEYEDIGFLDPRADAVEAGGDFLSAVLGATAPAPGFEIREDG